MIDLEVVRLVIRNRMLGMTEITTPPVPIAYENISFTPPHNAIWVREKFLPSREAQVASDQVSATGAMQYDVLYPVGRGTKVPMALAKALKDRFPVPSALQSGGVDVAIDQSENAVGYQEDVWYVIPTLVSWRVYGTANN